MFLGVVLFYQMMIANALGFALCLGFSFLLLLIMSRTIVINYQVCGFTLSLAI